MHGVNTRPTPLNVRLTIYRAIKQLLIILVMGFIIKSMFCDTVLINTDQMGPIIQHGDRVILSKVHFVLPFKWFFSLYHKDPVVFHHPHFEKKMSCLRIAGKPGDTVTVQDGIFSIKNKAMLSFVQKSIEEETLPAEYSPRDNMDPFWIPDRGDTITFDSLSIRDFIFYYSMIKQEKPHKHYTIKPMLFIDDFCTNDYIIKDFPLFSGPFNSIPDSVFTDWFFWDRLKAYLNSSDEDRKTDLYFSLLEDQSTVKHYIIRKKFYFLLSDNWCKGFDSRFFGPVISTAMQGKVVGILWSFKPDTLGIKALRGRKICKIIK